MTEPGTDVAVREPGELVVTREAWTALVDELNNALEMGELTQERLTDLYNAMDNQGWAPFGTAMNDRDTGPRLDVLHHTSQQCRALLAGNPMVQQGVEIRTGYIWGTGIELKLATKDGKDAAKTGGIPTLTAKNQKSLFSTRAQMELEFAAATDGNLFFILDKATKKAVWIPMGQITSVITDPEDPAQILFYRRSWSVTTTDTTGQVHSERFDYMYPAHDFAGSKPGSFGRIDVIPGNKAIIHIAFNTQKGWHFGIPDLFNVTWWVKGYKEYIEAGFSVTKSLAKIAMKTVSPTKAGMNRAAAKLAPAFPVVAGGDPATAGVVPGYGQTANLSGGSDISAINKSGAAFDFESGRSLAAFTAMGLGIDVDALLGENKVVGDNQLTAGTVKRMINRQGMWDDFLTDIATYFGIPNVNIRFPPVRTVAVHRAVQAVVTAAASGVMFPEEVRGMVVHMFQEYGIETLPGMPEAGEWMKFAAPIPPAVNDGQGGGGDPAHPGTTPQKTPAPVGKKGKKTPAGALADGDNTQRDSNK